MPKMSTTASQQNQQFLRPPSQTRVVETLTVHRHQVPGLQSRGAHHPPLWRRKQVKQVQLLKQFYQRCLRAIRGIYWKDHITNKLVLERANTTSIELKSDAQTN